MNSFLSHLHEELRRSIITRRGATKPPDQVKRGQHKEYRRMEHVVLPLPALDVSLQDALTRRSSAHDGDPYTQISHEKYGALLGHALRKREDSSRTYPSGGALYPIETYLIEGASPKRSGSVFHYHPTMHALERLWGLPSEMEVKSLAPRPESLPFTALLVFTSVWARSSAKYGDLSYQHALIEAGHMSQNVLLVATALGLRARPMAGFRDDALVKLLDIDPLTEQPVHSITLSEKERHEDTAAANVYVDDE